MAAFELIVHGYHVYKNVWTPAIGKEFGCLQNQSNDHDMHTVAIQGRKDALGNLSCEILIEHCFFLLRA